MASRVTAGNPAGFGIFVHVSSVPRWCLQAQRHFQELQAIPGTGFVVVPVSSRVLESGTAMITDC